MSKIKKLCCVILTEDENSTEIRKTIRSLKRLNLDSEYLISNCEESFSDIIKNISAEFMIIVEAGSAFVRKKHASDICFSDTENIYFSNVGAECGKQYPLRKTFDEKYSGKVQIAEEPEKIWTRMDTAFIRTDFLREYLVNCNVTDFIEKTALLTKLVTKNKGYTALDNIEIEIAGNLEYAKGNKEEMTEEYWYTNLFTSIDRIIAENDSSDYAKTVASYLIKMAMWENMNSRNKGCLYGQKVDAFFDSSIRVLKNIEDRIISKLPGTSHLNYYLGTLKHGGAFGDVRYENDDIKIVKGDAVYLRASEVRIYIPLMEYRNDILTIEALVPFPAELYGQYLFYAEYDGERIPFSKGSAYAQYKAFGRIVYCWHPISIQIPLVRNTDGEISFVCGNGEGFAEITRLRFAGSLSKLRWKNNYWVCDGNIITSDSQKLLIQKKTAGTHLKRELLFLTMLARKKKKKKAKVLFTRMMYLLTKPFFRKEIWLFEDKVFKGGDNGEYLYDYARKQNDGISKYYILSKGCLDAKRFTAEGKKYVKFGSLKHRLLLLNSDIVFATHKNSARRHGFEKFMNLAFRDRFDFSAVCIQHGLSVQYIPNLVNRINDNLKGFFLASPVERENLSGDEYGFAAHEDILKITGCPRYDGLVNNDKRQILITPTWRNYLAIKQGNADEVRGYNESFKNSTYYKLYNSLINDRKLIECARETGYKLIYLLHPATSSQIDDFDSNGSVELITATGNMSYEKILTESSLMVTDYSGVQFDFAYMYKPIVYFQPDELPPSYDEGYYDYATMALGDITKTVEETVDTICEYMRNDCRIKPEYSDRVDKFFKYHDHNNCKRVYDEIMRMREEGEL